MEPIKVWRRDSRQSGNASRWHVRCTVNTSWRRGSSLLYIALLAASGCDSPPEADNKNDYLFWHGATMGTEYHITLQAKPGLPTEGLRMQVETLIDEVNLSMSTYLPDSELMRLNRTEAHQELAVSKALFEVLRCALHISDLTQGAFDVTIAPLLALWGFGAQAASRTTPPEATAITAEKQRTGYQWVQINTSTRTVRKQKTGLFIDLSGIAKGYAVDQIAAYLKAQGHRHFMVEIGGEIRAQGNNPAGTPWQIGIEQPTAMTHRQALYTLSLQDTGLATSGDYRNFQILNGTRYPHIIDPATGHAVQHKLASVSVLHPSAMQADALATALMVMGEHKAYRFAERHDLPVLLIVQTESGPEIRHSPAWAKGTDQSERPTDCQSEAGFSHAVSFLASPTTATGSGNIRDRMRQWPLQIQRKPVPPSVRHRLKTGKQTQTNVHTHP